MTETQHILVVDDDVQLVDTVETLLQRVGYQVSHAYQAEKGLEMARSVKPDLILLDIMFAGPQGPNGVEISRRLHQDPDLSEIPVIMLSGVKKVLDMPVKLAPDEEYMPVKVFLEKPFTPDQLLDAIEEILGPRS